MKQTLYIKLLLFCLIGFAAACDKFESQNTSVPEEAEKVIDGTWKITKATRNGVDITGLMDFSQFRIRFNHDKTYSIANYLPFVVKADGTWSLDDPQYPFHLNLIENGSSETFTSTFNYPVVNGKRTILLSFSPGCRNNIYTYSFEKETSEN
ncbi:MAG: DUF5004 domain-containing protein [Candidatus Symbiothrix sp.]|jgi:hypothetical protein|nr:DUF5004 domain-containing protein [Candidatus Symbiothrix sp.]